MDDNEPAKEPHREKETMTEPQEEFIGDEAQPSKVKKPEGEDEETGGAS